MPVESNPIDTVWRDRPAAPLAPILPPPVEFAGETRDTSIKHEPCEPSGHTVKTYKADDPLSSAKPFVTHVFAG